MSVSFLVTEGEFDSQLLQRILPEEIVESTKFVVGEGVYGAESKARSIAAVKGKPVALVLDADTADEDAVKEKRESAKEMLTQTSKGVRSKVFIAEPEIEIVLFHDRNVLDAIVGGGVNDENFQEGQEHPRKVIFELLGARDCDNVEQIVLDRIDRHDIEYIRTHPFIRNIIDFLSIEEIASVSAEGPSNFLDAAFDIVNGYRRHRELHYAGIISNVSRSSGGAGPGPHDTDLLILHLRSGIDAPDARHILSYALEKLLKKQGLKKSEKRFNYTERMI